MNVVVANTSNDIGTCGGCDEVGKTGCWYLISEAGQNAIFGLVDSGSDYSLLSADIFYLLADEYKGEIELANVSLKNASGSQMDLVGKAKMKFVINGNPMHVEMLIAEVWVLYNVSGEWISLFSTKLW